MGLLKGSDREVSASSKKLRNAFREHDRKVRIKAMLRLMNRLWWKIPKKWAEHVIAEASDIPGLNGHFRFDVRMEKVVFEERKTICRRRR